MKKSFLFHIVEKRGESNLDKVQLLSPPPAGTIYLEPKRNSFSSIDSSGENGTNFLKRQAS
jgi:hypothetical protein